MLPRARAGSSGDRTRLDRTSCPGPSMMMPNGFARAFPGETGSQRVQPAACVGKDWCITHPIGQRCTDDQPTIKGRTSANFGYSKPLFACVHRAFGDQFIAPARAIFFWAQRPDARAGVLGLRACSCCARRRELRGVRGRPAERAVGAGGVATFRLHATFSCILRRGWGSGGSSVCRSFHPNTAAAEWANTFVAAAF